MTGSCLFKIQTDGSTLNVPNWTAANKNRVKRLIKEVIPYLPLGYLPKTKIPPLRAEILNLGSPSTWI